MNNMANECITLSYPLKQLLSICAFVCVCVLELSTTNTTRKLHDKLSSKYIGNLVR